MDVDFWAARVHSAKHITAVQSVRLGNHIVMEKEGEDEVRAWFPCPFCYIEIEVPLLCVHLQEEHCFDLRNAVCPICAANLGRDPICHFTVQHAHSIRRRKKSQKSGFWSNVAPNMVRDFRELSSFLGTSSPADPCKGNEPDPLLSPFLCNVPVTAPQEVDEDISLCLAATTDAKSSTPSPQDELKEQDTEERRERAVFVQELVFSTFFSDL